MDPNDESADVEPLDEQNETNAQETVAPEEEGRGETVVTPDEAVLQELQSVLVMDEELTDDGEAPKAKNQQVAQDVIDRPLDWRDLLDEDGTI
jgi:hypothetical protein